MVEGNDQIALAMQGKTSLDTSTDTVKQNGSTKTGGYVKWDYAKSRQVDASFETPH